MANSGASAGRLVAVLKAEPRGPTAFPQYYLLDLVVDVEHVLGGRNIHIHMGYRINKKYFWDWEPAVIMRRRGGRGGGEAVL